MVYNASAQAGVLISGVPDHPIEDVSLSNIQIWFKGGGTAEQAAVVPPERENDYPEPDRLGVMPAYGMYLRHIKGITVDNVRLHTLSDDARPPIALSNVEGAEFFRVKAQRTAGAPVFRGQEIFRFDGSHGGRNRR